MITIENLNKSFGSQVVFNDAGFQINSKEKIGLLGRNGSGKTTLIKMIAGVEDAGDTKINAPKNYKIAYVRQEFSFTKKTLIDEVKENLSDSTKTWLCEKVLFGLGFKEEDLTKDPNFFSGGFQIRINLAKILTEDADMLLLDEPNNYLDITSIRWLKNFLAQWKKEIILITHDKSFMDDVVSHVAGIHRKKIRKIKGNTENFYTQIEQDEEIYERQRINEEKKKKETLNFINKFRAKARLANLAQSRIKTLEKKEKLEKLEKIKKINFSFNYQKADAKNFLYANNLSFSYDKGKELISNFSVNIAAKDKICIIGKNGMGKSTLLKLLYQKIKADKGEIRLNSQVFAAYYEQSNVKSLNENNTILEELLELSSESQQKARDIAAAMLFEQDAALKKIKVLSGGEKARVLLAKILLSPCNLLFLDEPTNHLDIESCNALVNALKIFEGAIVLVTHNEFFLENLAEKIVLFQENKIRLLNLSYQEFLEKIGWQEEEKKTKETSGKKIQKKELKAKKAQLLNQKSQALKPIKKKIKELENTIEKKDKKTEEIKKALIEASCQNEGDKIAKLSQELHQIEEAMDKPLEDLEEAMCLLEETEKKFSNKILKI